MGRKRRRTRRARWGCTACASDVEGVVVVVAIIVGSRTALGDLWQDATRHESLFPRGSLAPRALGPSASPLTNFTLLVLHLVTYVRAPRSTDL